MASLDFYIRQWRPLPQPPTGPILHGKTAIVTGSNGGIGFETALHFAACSPSLLILAVRNLSSGAEALDKILEQHPQSRVEVWELDISKYASVKAFAERAEKELEKVDVLVNNAGQNPGFAPKPMQRTEDGHEQTVQVNALSTLLLTLLLQPLLAKSADPRISFVTSQVHIWAPTSIITDAAKAGESMLAALDNEVAYQNPTRYHISKLLLQMIVRKLIPALPHITIVSVTPGLCRTNLLRDRPAITLRIIPMIAYFLVNARSAEAGARNVTIATLLAEDSSEYWADCEPGASASTFLGSGPGFKATDALWAEVLGEMERVVPGSTRSLNV